MKKIVSIYLMGGLGNQLFQYSFIKNISLMYDANIIIDKSGISNKAHFVYQLDKYKINFSNIKFEDNSLRKNIGILLFKIYYRIPKSLKKIYNNFIKLFFLFGIYCIPNEYVKQIRIHTKKSFFIGYFSNLKYIDKNNALIIKKELELRDKNERIKQIAEKISNTKSVSIHIRKGDYVGSYFDVCSVNYYHKAIDYLNNIQDNLEFFVFSDDMEWVKNNIRFNKNKVNYISGNSASEDIYLMSKCKNFIISNSSFSYWGQYLSENDEKIVVAPSKWFNNGRTIDIYDDNWIKIDV